jgi:cell division control protein 6
MSVLYKNEVALSPDFLPEILPFREGQIRQVASNMEPVAEGEHGQNTFVFGPPGIGKTATVRFVFRQFEEEYPGVKTIYVNCWDCNTSLSVMARIANDIGTFVPRRGWGKDEVSQKLAEALSKYRYGVVVCLDEVDQLVSKEPGALYNLLRIQSAIQPTLIMISNDSHVLSRLETRVISSLNVEEVEFKPYSIGEMKTILTERAKLALSSFDSAAIMLAANYAVQRGGDVRVGLQCLQKAARLADRLGDSRLSASHMKDSLPKVGDARAETLKKKLNSHEKVVVGIVKKLSPVSFGELYDSYRKSVDKPSSERMFQDYVKHLAQARLIRLSDRKIGGKRIIYSP